MAIANAEYGGEQSASISVAKQDCQELSSGIILIYTFPALKLGLKQAVKVYIYVCDLIHFFQGSGFRHCLVVKHE